MLIPILRAAKIAGVSHMTIRRAVTDGALEGVTVDGVLKVRVADVTALYQKNTTDRPASCRVIAFANQKGGVGKTTTCANLAAALAQDGARVLAIDCDPQGNLTQALGVNPESLKFTLNSVIVSRRTITEALVPQPVVESLPNLHLVGADLDLAGVDIQLGMTVAREARLRQALAPVLDKYDYILLDSPPALGLLTLNVLAAATEVIIPIDMGIFSLRGVAHLQETILGVREINPGLKHVRALRNRTDGTNFSAEVAAELERAFGDDLLQTTIRGSVRVRESQAAKKPITIFFPSEKAANDYHDLAIEIKYTAEDANGA